MEYNMPSGATSEQYEEWAGFISTLPYNVRVCDRCGCDRHKSDVQTWAII